MLNDARIGRGRVNHAFDPKNSRAEMSRVVYLEV
jgi:hypothetical protein